MTRAEQAWIGAAVVLLGLAATLAGALAPGGILFPLDDAYITLANARDLLTGQTGGFGVSPLVGATSLAHLAAVAGLGRVLPLEAAALVLNGAAAIAYALGLLRLAALWGLSARLSAGLVVLGLAAGNVPFHLFNGLETGLAMAAVTWTLVFAVQGARLRLAVLCGVLPFVRPELAALAAGMLALRAWQGRASPAGVARDLGVAAAAALPFLLWQAGAGTGLVPNTSGAKAAFFAEAGYPAGFRAALVMAALGGSGILPVLAGAVFLWRAGPVAWPFWGLVLAFLAVMAAEFPGGLQHNLHRYLYPLLPVGLAGVALAARSGRAGRWILAGLVVLAAGQAALVSPRSIAEGRAFAREVQAAAAAMRALVPPGAVVLVHDAGHPAWATPFALVDVVGLKTPGAVAAHRTWTAPSRGRDRARALDAIARDGGATHAVVLDEPFWGGIATDLAAAGWGLTPLRQAPGGYAILALTPPPAGGPQGGPP